MRRDPEQLARIAAEKQAALDALRAAVAHYDTDPILPGNDYEDYPPFHAWDGCYSGRAIAIDETYVVLWSKASQRVAIVSHRHLPTTPELGKAYAITSWGTRLRSITRIGTRYIVNGKETIYDWLDAMDDFILRLQREVGYRELMIGRPDNHRKWISPVDPVGTFVLRARKDGQTVVATWYCVHAGDDDLLAYARRKL
jgi:hypothetical protein